MSEKKKKPNKNQKPVYKGPDAFLEKISTLSGDKIINQILDLDDPGKFFRSISHEDFFWIVKKVGDDDSIQLLELSSEEQWQYLLDMEIWQGDRLEIDSLLNWMKKLHMVDNKRAVRWIFSEGESLADLLFINNLEIVIVNDKDETYTLPEGYFSVDGIIYFKVIDKDEREEFENLIRQMARQDIQKYQSLFLSLMGILPAEAEEDLYRLRSVRLAERGFLPYEEALTIYTPLNTEAIKDGIMPEPQESFSVEDTMDMVPVSPLLHSRSKNMLTSVISGITDQDIFDKLQLEFAGLCNQIMSADRLVAPELEVLIKACQRASHILNLALERLCGNDMASAQQLLKDQSLVSLFRAGFGIALKVKWEAERWLKNSWFISKELAISFWGVKWGGMLAGLLDTRPQFYCNMTQEEQYKDFEWISEIVETTADLRSIMVLDGLLEKLENKFDLDMDILSSSDITLYPLLFNLWSRNRLELEPGFSSINFEKAQNLFNKLRGNSKKRPYKMDGFKNQFVDEFMEYAKDADLEAANILKETLSLIWESFCNEYEMVSVEDLDPRFSAFITIEEG